MPAHQLDQRRRAAFVRNMDDVDARRGLELLARKVPDTADARCAVAPAAGLLFHQLDQRLQIGRGRVGRRQDHGPAAADHADRGEVGQRVVRRLAHVGHDRHRPRIGDVKRVAIGRRLGHQFGRNHAAGAGLVIHHDRLAQDLAQALGDRTDQVVGAAARWIADHHAERLVRIVRKRGASRDRHRTQNQQPGIQKSHRRLLDREPDWQRPAVPRAVVIVERPVRSQDIRAAAITPGLHGCQSTCFRDREDSGPACQSLAVAALSGSSNSRSNGSSGVVCGSATSR